MTERNLLDWLKLDEVDVTGVAGDGPSEIDTKNVVQDNVGELPPFEIRRQALPPFTPAPMKTYPKGTSLPRSQQCCGNCNAFIQMGGPNGQWACAARPPTPLFMGMGQTKTLVGGRPQQFPIVNGFFPPVSEDIWCREWELKTD